MRKVCNNNWHNTQKRHCLWPRSSWDKFWAKALLLITGVPCCAFWHSVRLGSSKLYVATLFLGRHTLKHKIPHRQVDTGVKETKASLGFGFRNVLGMVIISIRGMIRSCRFIGSRKTSGWLEVINITNRDNDNSMIVARLNGQSCW